MDQGRRCDTTVVKASYEVDGGLKAHIGMIVMVTIRPRHMGLVPRLPYLASRCISTPVNRATSLSVDLKVSFSGLDAALAQIDAGVLQTLLRWAVHRQPWS